ncbi:MAG: MarR family transcriptional regulator [Acidimicrobiia bacterium]|nr:MarR family transcriptional regulator [Acidimicrobiia bacterium]
MKTLDLVTTLLDTATTLTRRLDGSLSSIKGITFSEYQMLSALRDQPLATATRVDIAGSVGLTPSGITRALKPMEKLGFVETTKDARDARKSLAKLTAAGHELVKDADGVVHDTVGDLAAFTSLSDDEREHLASVMKSVTAS